MKCATRLSGAGTVVMLVLTMSGCIFQDKVSPGIGIHNDSGRSVTVQRLRDQAYIPIHTLDNGDNSLISGPQRGECIDDAGLRVADESGTVIAQLGSACDGDTWVIRPNGTSAIMGRDEQTTPVPSR